MSKRTITAIAWDIEGKIFKRKTYEQIGSARNFGERLSAKANIVRVELYDGESTNQADRLTTFAKGAEVDATAKAPAKAPRARASAAKPAAKRTRAAASTRKRGASKTIAPAAFTPEDAALIREGVGALVRERARVVRDAQLQLEIAQDLAGRAGLQ